MTQIQTEDFDTLNRNFYTLKELDHFQVRLRPSCSSHSTHCLWGGHSDGKYKLIQGVLFVKYHLASKIQ